MVHALAAVLAVSAGAANSSLSLPLPPGYRDVSPDAVAARPDLKDQGVIALVGMRGDAIVASINLVPAKHDSERLDDDRKCADFADDMMRNNKGRTRAWAIVDAPRGRTCQITIVRKDERTVIHTLLRGPKDTWLMTCVFAADDRASDGVCRRAVKTIRFHEAPR